MWDVIVIGLGAMGSAAAQHVAQRGRRVLGLEQYEALHSRGSSHGASRMIRQSYWEHPDYVPLLLHAYELWERLERDSGADLLRLTGGLVVGSQTGELVRRSKQSASQHGLPHEMLTAAEVRRRYPAICVDEDDYALFEPRAGYLRAEECVRQQLRAATQAGAELHFGEQVMGWRVTNSGSVEVTTNKGSYEAERLILTAGPWTSEVIRGMKLPLTVTRQVLYWFVPRSNAAASREDQLPVYLFEAPEGEALLYGFPETADEPGMVKVALHGSKDVCAPADVDREVYPHEIEAMRRRLEGTLPLLAGDCAKTQTCLYTMTPDEHFIVDVLPDAPQVSLACGFSGHGFKFANLIGEVLADLSQNANTNQPIDIFLLKRFN